MNPFRTVRKYFRDARAIREWRAAGSPVPPPPALKQKTVRAYATKFHLPTFVETGTFKGDMIDAIKADFNDIHSIELGKDLHTDAQKRFTAFSHIHLHQGDSATVLPELLKILKAPILFWLDGHFSAGITARGSKDTPIVEELAAIYRHDPKAHVILIDDARLFNGKNDYPSIDELKNMVGQWSPGTKVEVADDIIRLAAA